MSETLKVPPYLTTHDRWNAFLEFHLSNKHVFRKILKEIENGKAAGLKKISVKHIISHLRWDMQLLTKTTDFKINDGYTGIYTHLILHNYPEYKDILTTKPLTSLKKQESGQKAVG
jgi:hypothetical protein